MFIDGSRTRSHLPIRPSDFCWHRHTDALQSRPNWDRYMRYNRLWTIWSVRSNDRIQRDYTSHL